jgi:hypothetical protein
LYGASKLWANGAVWRSGGWRIAAKAAKGLLYYGSNMTTVRNLKDEVDKRAYHKMLKQLGLSEEDVA